jgi:hypothetical protein
MGKHEAQSLAGPKMLKQLDALSETSPALAGWSLKRASEMPSAESPSAIVSGV